MDAALLDTDLLSEILKQRDPVVVQKSSQYLQEHGQFSFSIFTRFDPRPRVQREAGYSPDSKIQYLLSALSRFAAHRGGV